MKKIVTTSTGLCDIQKSGEKKVENIYCDFKNKYQCSSPCKPCGCPCPRPCGCPGGPCGRV